MGKECDAETLLGSQSRSARALWMMEEAGLPYERVLVDIRTGDQSSADYARINPMMKVPALADGDVSLAESAAICAYMAEKAVAADLAPPVGSPQRAPLPARAVLRRRLH